MWSLNNSRRRASLSTSCWHNRRRTSEHSGAATN
jgi:hypothetical protein